MARTRYEMITAGLRGIPMNDLVEGWSIIIKEVAPYVSRVEAKNTKGV